MATNVGTIEVIAKLNTAQYKKGTKEIDEANKKIENSSNEASRKSSGAFTKLAKVGLATLATASVAVGVAVTKNIGGAIRRVDTLANASRTFQNIGFATDDVTKSMKALEKSITGLPTPLDSAVRGMTALSSSYGDISKGQKVFTALNNAILGFGGSTAEVENAITQLSQLPLDGPLDAQTWNSLRNSGLTPVLVALSKDMGMSVDKMKKKLGDGELTVRDFTDALVKMNTDGAGGMQSLEKIVADSTSGIQTGWANMQTAITRGIANIIQTIGQENISGFITNIGKAFEGSLNAVGSFAKATIDFFKEVSKNQTTIAIVTGMGDGFAYLYDNAKKIPDLAKDIWKQFGNLPEILQAQINPLGFIIKNFESLKDLFDKHFLPSLKALWGTISTQLLPVFGTMIDTVIRLYNALQPALTTVIKVIGYIIGGVLVGAIWLLINGLNHAIKVLSFVINIFLDLVGWIANVISWIGNFGVALKDVFMWAKNNWTLIFAILTGPIGLAILAIIKNFDKLKSIAGTVMEWFGNIGSAIGNALGNAFKTAVNAVLGFLESRINNIVDVMNGAIHLVDNITPGSLDRIDRVALPRLAEGGIVTSPTLALVGEGRESEAVIPLSKLDKMITEGRGGDIEVTQNIFNDIDMERSMRELAWRISY